SSIRYTIPMLPRIYLLLCVIFWGWTFVATRIVLEFISPVELLGLRFLIGLPILYPIMRAKKISIRFSSRDRWPILLGAAIITIHFIIQITGLKYTTATNTGWIISITPLVMVTLSFLILKERIGRFGLAGIAVASAGILVLVSGGRFETLDWLSSTGDWLILASAHTWALYTIAIRNLSRRHHPLAVTFAVLTPSAVVVIGYMALTSDWSRFLQLSPEAMIALLFLGILGMAVAHWFWQEGVAALGASRAGLFLYVEPLATTALAVPYLGESFTIFTAIGGLLVLAGVFISQVRGRPG
ncbi:MAG: DMT family transporter, partial [candidate division Zixibacteria bacterium]